MTMTDPLGDMLTRIRNGQRASLPVVRSPGSKLRANLLEVLKREGYIRDYSEAPQSHGQAELTIELKYSDGRPVIREIIRVSKPGRRVYRKIKDLGMHRGGMGVAILSTPQGLMTDHDARQANVGGEVLCQVF